MARALLKKWMMATGFAFSALGVSVLAEPHFMTQAVQQVTIKYAQYNGLKAFEKPTITSKAVGTYTLNNPVHILKSYNRNYYEVHIDSQKGYIQKEYVSATPYFVKAVKAYTPGDTLNVRTGPGVGYRQMGALYNKDRVQVLEKTTSKWYQVDHRGEIGYVSAAYVTKN